MTNADIHLFKTRDGKWKCRVECDGQRLYTRECTHIKWVMEDVGMLLEGPTMCKPQHWP